jgi:hypothetical protein
VPLHEERQGRIVCAAEEVIQQLAIGPFRPVIRKHGPAKVSQDLAQLVGRHLLSSVDGITRLYSSYYGHRDGLIRFFRELAFRCTAGCCGGLPLRGRGVYHRGGKKTARTRCCPAEGKRRRMNPKPRPNHRRYIEILRQMTPAQRLQKAFELSALTRAQFAEGLRKRFPSSSELEFRALLLRRFEQEHNRND